MREKDLTCSPFFCKLEKIKKEVNSYIDLTISSPIKLGLSFDLSSIVENKKDDLQKWINEPSGGIKTRKAISDYYKKRGGSFLPEQIFLTASTSEAYSIIFKVFGNPHDTVLTPYPSYPLLETLIELENLKSYPYFLKLHHFKKNSLKQSESYFQFLLDTDSFLSAPESAKILLLVCPHNPTGHSVSLSEFKEAVSFCEEKHLTLVIDEVFGDYTLNSPVKRSYQFLEMGLKPKCPIIWLNGLSKTCGSPQIKLSWMALYAPEEIKKSITDKIEYVLDAYLNVSSFSQILAPSMLENSLEYEKKILEILQENLEFLQKKVPYKYCPKILGGWYAPIRLGGDDEKRTLELLHDKKVLVQPGFFFDFEEEGWIVVSLLQLPHIFKEGIKKIL